MLAAEPFETAEYPVTIGTPHPYPDNAELQWAIMPPRLVNAIRVRFAAFVTESGDDYLTLRSSLASVNYTGDLGAFTSEWVPGTSLTVEFTSDYAATAHGFDIEAYEVQYATGTDVLMWTIIIVGSIIAVFVVVLERGHRRQVRAEELRERHHPRHGRGT